MILKQIDVTPFDDKGYWYGLCDYCPYKTGRYYFKEKVKKSMTAHVKDKHPGMEP